MPPLKTKLTTIDICTAAALETEGELPEPAIYLRQLFTGGMFSEAVRFLAHAQEPRDCIEWGAQALESTATPPATPEQKEALQAVKVWLATPDDAARRTAKERAEAALDTPDGTLAMAVFFSGGSITPPNVPEVPPPLFTCHKFVAGAVTLAVVSQQPEQAEERFGAVLALRQPDIASKTAS